MKYKEGTFGYWWTVTQGNEDIKNQVHDEKINCSDKNLTSLEGAPKEVRGDFWCSNNNLKTLKNAPEKVKGDFYCYNNQLKSLKDAPNEVQGDFFCGNNQLKSLDGSPKEIQGNFWCQDNRLDTLNGMPKIIRKEFNCSFNSNLKSIDDIMDVFDSEIGEFESDIISDREYQEYKKIYKKVNNKSKFLKLLKLKDLVK